MTPEIVCRLIPLLEGNIIAERSTAIPVHLQVLITLRFLAEGSLQKGFSQDFQHPVSQSTASRCINRICNAINSLGNRFVKFPTTEDVRERIQYR